MNAPAAKPDIINYPTLYYMALGGIIWRVAGEDSGPAGANVAWRGPRRYVAAAGPSGRRQSDGIGA
jgi:hypothetical protein